MFLNGSHFYFHWIMWLQYYISLVKRYLGFLSLLMTGVHAGPNWQNQPLQIHEWLLQFSLETASPLSWYILEKESVTLWDFLIAYGLSNIFSLMCNKPVQHLHISCGGCSIFSHNYTLFDLPGYVYMMADEKIQHIKNLRRPKHFLVFIWPQTHISILQIWVM